MTKGLRKVGMNRPKERNQSLKTKRFNCRRNFCVSLLCKTYIFWKIIGPLFSEKTFYKDSIIFNNNNKIISNNEELAETFNECFNKVLDNFDIEKLWPTI